MPVNSVARARMTHRCTISRSTATGSTAYAPQPSPTWANLATGVPCFGWSTVRSEQIDPERTEVREDARVMLRSGTAVTEKDRIVDIVDRLGAPVLSGSHEVIGVLVKATHIEALLKAHR